MIEEVPSRGLAYRFTHELVRRALYDRLTALRRAELHLRVGEAARAAPRGAPARTRRPRAPLRLRRPVGGPARAIRLQPSRRAGRGRASRSTRRPSGCRPRSSWGSRAPPSSAGGRRSSSAGQPPGGQVARRPRGVSVGGRGDRARARRRAQLLARAAIGFEDACWRPGMADQGAVELLEEAAAALGEEDSSLRVGLLGGLARALDFQGDHVRGAVVRTHRDRRWRAGSTTARASPPC